MGVFLNVRWRLKCAGDLSVLGIGSSAIVYLVSHPALFSRSAAVV